MREVKFDSFNKEDIDTTKEAVGYEQFMDAVGYLSTWAIGSESYPKATLWFDPKELDITATYYKEDGSVGYVIGGVWSVAGKSYSFHS